jgi:hypothetical protein
VKRRARCCAGDTEDTKHKESGCKLDALRPVTGDPQERVT